MTAGKIDNYYTKGFTIQLQPIGHHCAVRGDLLVESPDHVIAVRSSNHQRQAGAWVRNCPAARTDLEVRCPGQSGVSISGAPPAGTERLAESRLEGIGNWTRSQVLFIDTLRAQAAPL